MLGFKCLIFKGSRFNAESFLCFENTFDLTVMEINPRWAQACFLFKNQSGLVQNPNIYTSLKKKKVSVYNEA